jgi:hypothetical protein
MNGKTILSSPVTQTAAAVKQLIIFQNHGQVPAEMPAFCRLSADLVLVRNNKGDAYYVTTPKSCSCPAATYNPGHPCKHARKYFPQPKREVSAPAVDSIRPEGKWHGHNGPWIEDEVMATGEA